MSQDNQAVKLICTLGPISKNKTIVDQMKARGVALFRINMSHTKLEDLEGIIQELRGYDINICLDTEGCQVRTGYLGKDSVFFKENTSVKLYGKEIPCDDNNIYIRPEETLKVLRDGDIISLDFNSVMIKVTDASTYEKEGYLSCDVLIGGPIGNNKGVAVIGKEIKLPAFSEKDRNAIEIAKKYNIENFTISFIDHPDEVKEFKRLYNQPCKLYSKIETRLGLQNFKEILSESDGILIDRGDLSREVQLEKIPLIQKILTKYAREKGKECFVATNILETMCTEIKPNRAEVNDVINILEDGATALVLTKETAVGNNPVATVNMAMSLIEHQAEFNSSMSGKSLLEFINSPFESHDYICDQDSSGLLNKPHGGKLVQRNNFDYDKDLSSHQSITINKFTMREIELIANGSFSPIEGFTGREDLVSILDRMRLKSDLIWTIPITLRLSEKEAENLKEGEDLVLKTQDGIKYAILHLDEKYQFPIEEYCLKLFGTVDRKHPGVERMHDGKNVFLAGKITLLEKFPSNLGKYNLSPIQVRKIFSEKGWSKIVGFHTRNVIHRSHEFVQLTALKNSGCDGLFVQPVIGQKKSGDFVNDIIMESYEMMVNNFYPQNQVVLSGLNSNSYYGGPREAIFTALCRKNYGCSHFIVGRDHTGVFDFYEPYDSHKIFDKFPDLGIQAVKFKEVSYNNKSGYHFKDESIIGADDSENIHISGSKIRKMLSSNESPENHMIRTEVIDIIREAQKNNREVFVK